MAINNDLFRYGGGRMIAAFILVWLVIAFVSWLGFQIWWNRREKVYAAATAHDDFVAIPVFSHFIQTFGEWAGMFVGIGGALLTLIAAIFLNGDASMLRMMGTGAFFGSGSLIYIVLNPIYGFIIVVVTRAAAETFRALAAIANNTKKADRALLRGRYFPPPAPSCGEGGTFHRPHHFCRSQHQIRRAHNRSSQLHLQFRTDPKELGTRRSR